MDEVRLREHVELIREVFYYSHRFQDKTFVFKIDYPMVMEKHFPNLLRDLALLHQTGIHVVIVPGAKERIDEVLKEYGEESQVEAGIRISTAEDLPFIKMAAFDVVNKFMTPLSGFKVNALVGNWVRARGLGVINGVDYQFTGKVEKVNAELLEQMLDGGHIPILPCIGWSSAGQAYNISSDDLALAVCETLGAEKLFFISESEGIDGRGYDVTPDVERLPDGRVPRMSVSQAQALLELNQGVQDVDLHYIKQALAACKKGVERVHLVDGRTEGVILKEIFSNIGIGTMIYSDDYESIRSMTPGDVSDVHRLMKPLIDQGILVNRTEEDLIETYHDYVVYEVDGAIHACGALHTYQDGQGEIAAIATNPSYAHLSMGKKILGFLVSRAIKLELRRVFVLTTQTTDWFHQMGFKEADLETLPEKKQVNYNRQRKSKIFAKEL
ncbi:MAG: amino-acid N-acetyltransferase [Spirochaetes bacterium GWB1_48_6]|nr:MAG: amino-acid N-acetyltransferase [Spirochaetes bacterium GWB1_48_6]